MTLTLRPSRSPGDVSPARQPARVDLAEEVEVRRGRPAPRRPLGHDAPDPGGRQLLAGAELRRLAVPALARGEDVRGDERAVRSASGDEGVEVDAALGRQAAGLRRGQPAPRDPGRSPGRHGLDRGGRRRLDGGTGPPRSRSSARSSPDATITATVSPTGTSAPSGARTPARRPSAGASISTVTLSVSTSIRGSPFATSSPSALSQRRTLPVSWAIPSAGMITSVATASGSSTPRSPRLRRGRRRRPSRACPGSCATPSRGSPAAARRRCGGPRPRS